MVRCIIFAFTQDTYSFLVSEDVPLQTTVGTVFADDSDLGSNANTRFLIVEGDAAILFNLVTNAVAGPSGTQRFAGVLTTRQVGLVQAQSTVIAIHQLCNVCYPV